MKTITDTEDFPGVFRSGQESFDIIYLMQCEVRRMRKTFITKVIFKTIKLKFLTGVPVKRSAIHHVIGFMSIASSMSPSQRDFLQSTPR
jgi:hypothetical protein